MPAILLTRPMAAARPFAEALQARLGAVRVVIAPLMRIEWRDPGALPDAVAVFTSARGVEGFLRAKGKVGRCWCVGDATAEAARKAGFEARSARGDAAVLIRAIIDSGEAGPFVHIRGAHARGDVAGGLRAAGRVAQEAVVYDQVAQAASPEAAALLDGECPVIVPLFSPRSARQFQAIGQARAPIFVAAMSAAVRDALSGMTVAGMQVAARPDAEAMVVATKGLFDAAQRLEGGGGAG